MPKSWRVHAASMPMTALRAKTVYMERSAITMKPALSAGMI